MPTLFHVTPSTAIASRPSRSGGGRERVVAGTGRAGREGDVDGVGVAPGLLGVKAEMVDHRCEIVEALERRGPRRLGQPGRRRGTGSAVGALGDPAPGQGAVAPDPDRHVPRLRVHADRRRGVAAALEAVLVGGPHAAHRFERLVEQLVAPLEVDAERGYSLRRYPGATESVNRPPDSASIVAAASATMNGLRYGSTMMFGMSRIRSVTAAT